jgi:hypothetical protein
MFFTDNGGPPGILYELLVAGIYYCFIAASLAEVGNFLDTYRIATPLTAFFRYS